MEHASTGYSVVMTAWNGEPYDWEKVGDVTEKVLERKGLDDFSLTLGAKDHLPAELADGLQKERAENLVAQLSEAGAVAEVIPSAEVAGVKHRASEVWASYCKDNRHLTEVDGLIIHLVAINARHNVAYYRRTSPDLLPGK